jgi:hypothetical protein
MKVAQPRSERFIYRPYRTDPLFLNSFPALRTGLLSFCPSRTGPEYPPAAAILNCVATHTPLIGRKTL